MTDSQVSTTQATNSVSEKSRPATPPSLSATQLPPSFLTWSGVLDRLGRGEELSEAQVQWAMEEIMGGKASDGQIAAFAFGMRVKGPTAAELAAAAAAMRSFARPVDFSSVENAVDIVGTGGDGHHTVNISTMAAFVIAATGTPVVKHGNRAASSKSGGADMLEALGVDIEREPELLVSDLDATNFAFMFAKTYHPAMRFAGPVRSELKAPTLFNFLGPLTNPARPRYGLIGCAFSDVMPIMAGAFAQQGDRVLVVRGMDGMDEISVSTPTNVIAVDSSGNTSEHIISPLDLGLSFHPQGALTGGDAEHNAGVARRLFSGELEGAVKDAVLINAAAALATVEGWEDSDLLTVLREQVEVAREALESGRAQQALETVLRVSGRDSVKG